MGSSALLKISSSVVAHEGAVNEIFFEDIGPEMRALQVDHGISDLAVVTGGARQLGKEKLVAAWRKVVDLDVRWVIEDVFTPKGQEELMWWMGEAFDAGKVPLLDGDDEALPPSSPLCNNDRLAGDVVLPIMVRLGREISLAAALSTTPIRDYQNGGEVVSAISYSDIDAARERYVDRSLPANNGTGPETKFDLGCRALEHGALICAVVDGNQPRPLTGVLTDSIDCTRFMPDAHLLGVQARP